jgi:hypothetical protein
MWRMARGATFSFDDVVLVYERSGCFGVALGADRIHL